MVGWSVEGAKDTGAVYAVGHRGEPMAIPGA